MLGYMVKGIKISDAIKLANQLAEDREIIPVIWVDSI